jgi:hypothetical protein
MTFNLTWNDGTVTSFTDLPVKVQEIFGSYGHATMQRFASAKANGDVRKAIVNGSDRKVSDVTTKEVNAWREANTAQYESWANKYMDEFKASALAGSIEMPGVSGESMTQDELDRRAAAKKTIDDVYAAAGQKYGWPRAEKGSGEEGAIAAEQAREAIYQDFFQRYAQGGDFCKIFDRNLRNIKKERAQKNAPVASGGLDLLAAKPVAAVA